ncbi:sulfite exporter TauE/SafE family protein [Pelagibius sp.]|uniref:sulfite exporter TauE/SafE family protein n=1 Tax=Pelagibius sp. TaxID=1931238 RepID=UPI002628155D|nr:sulfite exporter TauE/SafE family protein [Pelagibius sp.]
MELTAMFVAAALVLAGTVKGAVGLGLPPIAMGFMVLVMPPVEAAALLVIPAFFTNAWQMLMGPHLRALLRRVWPLLVGAFLCTLLGADWLTEENARIGTIILGVVLAAYAASSLVSLQVTIGKAQQGWFGALAGGLTGLVTAATGVSSMPMVPYMQAIGLEKDELIQAMGLSFTVSSVALAINLASVQALSWSLGPAVAGALAAVTLGLWLGQIVRRRLNPATFRTLFLIVLLVLGLYLALRSLLA